MSFAFVVFCGFYQNYCSEMCKHKAICNFISKYYVHAVQQGVNLNTAKPLKRTKRIICIFLLRCANVMNGDCFLSITHETVL